jgi:UDP-N-acetyl-D-mannosaminuronate dehydrogenase
MKIGILGVGEVGMAIRTLAEPHYRVKTKDLDHDQLTGADFDILHVCIPFGPTFVDAVCQVLRDSQVDTVIINSSVKPGTTREIYERITQSNPGKLLIAHTPIMGVHPHLAEYQHIFDKVVGAIGSEAYKKIKQHWLVLGAPRVVRFGSPEASETAKLLSTTYYGWSIFFNKMVKRVADASGLEFDQIYTRFNQIYNAGYAQTKPEVVRPILEFMPGKIGGHCVIPNIEILRETYDEETFDWMLKWNEMIDIEEDGINADIAVPVHDAVSS